MSYCTDLQILAVDPRAASYLSTGEANFTRIRGVIESRINDNLRRRSPPILPSDLADTTELTNCEIYGVLAELLFKSASRAGRDGVDWFTQEAIRYQQMHEREIDSPLSVTGDAVARVGGIRMRRC